MSKKQQDTKSYNKLYALKVKLRKWTTPIHLAGGAFCAWLVPYYPVASALLVASFAFFEWWQWKKTDDTGDQDFWEAIVGFVFGMISIMVLQAVHVVIGE